MMRKKMFVLLSVIAACVTVAAAGCKSDNGGNNGENKGDTEQKTYTVAFDSAGGSDVQSVTVKEGTTLNAPETPVKATFSARYEFAGWYYEGRQWSFETDVVSEDITLTAEWKLAEEYTKVYPAE